MKGRSRRTKRIGSMLIAMLYIVVTIAGFGNNLVFAAAEPQADGEIGRGKPAYASRSAENTKPSNANDGDKGTRWYDGSQSAGNWLYVDLGKDYDITQVVFHWGTDASTHPKGFQLQLLSDGENPSSSSAPWRTVDSFAGTNNLLTTTIDMDDYGRYVRLYITAAGTWGSNVFEMEIYEYIAHNYIKLDAADGELIQGTAGQDLVADETSNGTSYVHGFDSSGDGAGVKFTPEYLAPSVKTYELVLGYARYIYETADTISVYVNDEFVKQVNVFGETSDPDEILRTRPFELDLIQGDTVTVQMDTDSGDQGLLRLYYLEIQLVDENVEKDPEVEFRYDLLRVVPGETVILQFSYGDIDSVNLVSSDPSVVSLDGDVAAAGVSGEATITASLKADPEVTAACKIIVADSHSPTVYKLEAEDGRYIHGSKGAQVFRRDAANASGGAVADGFYDSGNGAGVEFTMPDDMDEMVYELSVQYGRDTYLFEMDYMSIWVNGEYAATYDCPSTGSYNTYQFGPYPVQLKLKGGDVVKLGVDTARDNKGLYRMDMIELTEMSYYPPQEINFTEDIQMLERETAYAKYTTVPENANTEILWESSNEEVASVEEGGVVRAIRAGTTIITAKSLLNPEVKGSMIVTVGANDKLDTIKSDQLEVVLSKEFPRAYEYRNIDENGISLASMQGSNITNNKITVNNVTYEPEVTYEKLDESSAQYTIPIEALNAEITVVLTAEDNAFKLEVTEVKESGNSDERIFTIAFPDHNIVSVSSREADAAFAGSYMVTELGTIGDTYTDLTAVTRADVSAQKYLYAFLSNEDMAVGIRSNSNYETTRGTPGILKQTVQEGSAFVTGLWSSPWNYRGPDYTKKFQDMDGRYGQAGAVITKTYQAEFTEELPLIYLAFAFGDQNNDDQVDWQDGAVVFRDVMETAIGMDYIPDAVVQRLVFPQSGEGNYPYIASLDETKRVYLATDGLGQLVLNKYHNEGIWGDFKVFDERLGGIDGFNYYVSESVQNYNAWQGVHTNFVEIYTSATEFRPERIMMEANGITPKGLGFAAYNYWLQQCYQPDVTFDAISLERMDRLVGFAEDVPDLGFIYSDVFSHSGWQGRRLAKEYEAAGLSYFVEWPYQNEAEGVWAHWAVEKAYGSSNLIAYNSDIARFIFNHTKDRWDNYSDTYRLPNSSKLLMGADTTLYEGWPNRDSNNSFEKAMEMVFNNNLPTKYMQHFPILRMEKDDEGWASHIWFEDGVEVFSDENNGGQRTITKDGKVIYTEDSYLLPWDEGLLENSDEEEKEVKLYHWNENGGTTTWELPDSWDGVSQVYVYQLTDLGRTGQRIINVTDGSITLSNMDKTTAYVVYKEAMDYDGDIDDVEYGDGSYVKDPGFNYGDLSAWTVESGNEGPGEVFVAKNDTTYDDYHKDSTFPSFGRNAPYGEQRNYELIIDSTDESIISQEISGLAPGEYAASVMVEIQQGERRKASVIVESGDKVYSNYADKSIVLDYDEYDSKIGTHMLRMRVTFEVPEGSDSVKLTLHAEEGTGRVRFDNVRIYETTTPEAPEGSSNVVLFQDFEYAVKEGEAGSEDKLNRYKPTYEGYYPFVLGSARGIHETRNSIQTANPPYTKNGENLWDPSTIPVDDVLEGQKALKIVGISATGVAMQTIPQTVRFEQGKTYRVSFKYQTQPAPDYSFVVGYGQQQGFRNTGAAATVAEYHVLQPTSETITFSTEFTAEKEDCWVGIYRTRLTNSVSVNPTPIIIDDLLVEEVINHTLEELQALVDEADEKLEADYTPESWEVFEEALLQAKAVLAKGIAATVDEITSAFEALNNAMNKLEEVKAPPEVPGDKYALDFYIRLAETIDTSDMISSAVKELENALKHAKVIYDKEDATEEEIFDATVDLAWAIAKSEWYKGDPNALENLVEICDLIDLDKYENGKEKEDFTNALAEAKDILAEKDNCFQYELDAAFEKLENAMTKLIPKKDLDWRPLLSAIALANTIDLDKYVDNGKTEFTNALQAGLDLLDAQNVTQDQIKQTADDLLEAIANLKLKPDKTYLGSMIEKARGIQDLSRYTPASVSVFMKVLGDATELFNDETLTKEDDQDTIDALARELKKAIDNLVPINGQDTDGDTDEDTNGNTNGDTDGDTNGDTNGGTDGQSDTSKDSGKSQNQNGKNVGNGKASGAKTGDSLPVVFIMLSIVSLLVLIAGKERKNL